VATKEIRITVDERIGEVSGLLDRPRGAKALYVLAHGAGAGMQHKFMEALVPRLAARGVATLRYQFPYMEKGSRRPDSKKVLLATVRAAAAFGVKSARGLPVFVGGKSMGGRMTSLAAAEEALPGVEGIVFVGFPLHAAGRDGVERADHLQDVHVPMLFLQGTRDTLADLDSIKAVVKGLGKRGKIQVVEGGDHSFHVLKRSGRTDDEALDDLAEQIAAFVEV
jgi:hypothetical protein